MAERAEFVEGEVVIYEGHLNDKLVVVEKIYKRNHTHRPSPALIRNIDGREPRDTTVDRLRKATRTTLTNEILRLEASLVTLRGAMRDYSEEPS